MSTKIYNGYRLPATNLAGFGRELTTRMRPVFFRELQTVILNVLRRLQAAEDGPAHIRWMGEFYQLRTERMIKLAYNHRWAAFELMNEFQIALSAPYAQRAPLYDMGMEVNFLTDPEQPESVLAILFTERETYRRVWRRVPGVIKYGYWDNTDEPHGISRKAWRARGAAWERAMPGFETPGENGVHWRLSTRNWEFEPPFSAKTLARKLTRTDPGFDWLTWLGEKL